MCIDPKQLLLLQVNTTFYSSFKMKAKNTDDKKKPG